MLSGKITLDKNNKEPFKNIIPAHSDYVEIGTVVTEVLEICIIVERDVTKNSIAENYYGQKISQKEYKELKSKILDWSLQSVFIEKNKADEHVDITRNHRAECGLYFIKKENILYLNWDPAELYPYLDKSDLLDIKTAISHLELIGRYRYQTVFKNLFMLPERGKAILKLDSVEIIKPPHIDPQEAVPLKDGVDPVEKFHELIRGSVARWPVEPEHVGAILSSGLDTTIAANFLNERVSSQPLPSFGYWMLDDKKQRDGIKDMRLESVKLLNLDDYYLPVEESLDEVSKLKEINSWVEQGLTAFLEDNLAKHMISRNVNFATTGIGGDELSSLTSQELANLSLKDAPDQWEGDPYEGFSLVSKKYKSQTPTEDDFYWPRGYVGISSPSMASNTGLSYLRKGVWLVHPLSAADLHAFSCFLPMEWRRNRHLSREALKKLGWSEHFVKQIPKEDLTQTVIETVLKVDWEDIFNDAIIFSFDLIDKEAFFKGLEIFKETHSIAVGIKLVKALTLELGLQSVYKVRALEKAA